MAALVQTGTGDFRADYADMVALSADSQALVDEVDILLGARLGTAAKASIKAAVDAIPTSAGNAGLNRSYTAILLTLASPDYLVQK
jgi:hypothetical protein